MLAQFTDFEIFNRFVSLIQGLSGSQLVGGAELRIMHEVQIRRQRRLNEDQLSWDLSKLGSHLVRPLHYIDKDGIRVDLNISVNERGEVVEANLWKYAYKDIIEFPSQEQLRVQETF